MYDIEITDEITAGATCAFDHGGTLSQALRRTAGGLAAVLDGLSESSTQAAQAVISVLDTGCVDPEDPVAVANIVDGLALPSHHWDLTVLAALSDVHEAFATALRLAHPEQEPYPTAGLAARVIDAYAADRTRLRRDLVGPRTELHTLITVDGGAAAEGDTTMKARA